MEAHGATPDERERGAGACILYDTRRHRVIAATQGRFITTGDAPISSTRAEAIAMAQGLALCRECNTEEGAEFEATSDSQSMLQGLASVERGVTSRQRERRRGLGALLTAAEQASHINMVAAPGWNGAEHNMDPYADEKREPTARLNWGCDVLAGVCARSVEKSELEYHGYWDPLPAAQAPPYYITTNGRAWSDEPVTVAKRLVGAQCMRRAKPAECVGKLQRHIEDGVVHGEYTLMARKLLSPGAQDTAARRYARGDRNASTSCRCRRAAASVAFRLRTPG